MRVIGLQFDIAQEASACQIYRTNMPVSEMGKHGHKIAVESWEYICKQFRSKGWPVFSELAYGYDIFIFPRVVARDQRTYEGLSALIALIRQTGGRSVYEVDDDFTNRHRDLSSKGVIRAVDVASWCDAVTVTTDHLGKVMTKSTGRPSYTLPNMISPEIWKHPERSLPHEGLIIGLSGSPTHAEDWKVLDSVLPRILANDYGQKVTLRLTGFYPEGLRELPNVDLQPPLDYATYAEMIRDCDLVLAPVIPLDGFNLCKSPIKVIEGMAATRNREGLVAGAACIATDNPVYRLAIQDRRNGLLVSHDEESWYNAIDLLLRDASLRHRLQLAGHSWVWKRHDITSTWTQWLDAYQSIKRRQPNTCSLPS